MKKRHILASVAAAAVLVLTGCSDLVQRIAPVADTVAGVQCGAPYEVRFAERKAYYEANGKRRLLVGFCEGEAGFDNAVQEYIVAEEAKAGALYGALGGDFADVVNQAIKYSVDSGGLKSDADGCFLLQDIGRFCPVVNPPPRE